jgi:hypothetical protein
MPTSEIAKLAAILAHGRDISNPQSLSFIATQTIALYEQCEKARASRIDMLALYARAEALTQARKNYPRPKKFPISMDEFLRCLMPKKRSEDRAKCQREYVRQMIRYKVPTDADIAECLEREKKEQIAERLFDVRADDFRRFLKEYEAANKLKRARAGAEGLKKKREQNA